MNDQPKPAGEWTVAKLASYINRDGRLDDKRLLQDINAALAAEREQLKITTGDLKLYVDRRDELARKLAAERETSRYWKEQWVERGAQLAAEQERADKNADVIEATALELHDVRQQLAAEQSKGSASVLVPAWQLAAEKEIIEMLHRQRQAAERQRDSVIKQLAAEKEKVQTLEDALKRAKASAKANSCD